MAKTAQRGDWHVSVGYTGLDAPQKFDISIPLNETAQFLDELNITLQDKPTTAVVFGHIGDGNLHVNLLSEHASEELDELTLGLVAKHGGSISAEHGIGTAKAKYLHLSRSPEEIKVFRMLKQTFDPNGILNPHALLP